MRAWDSVSCRLHGHGFHHQDDRGLGDARLVQDPARHREALVRLQKDPLLFVLDDEAALQDEEELVLR